MDDLISKISFFSDKAIFETISDSNSGAILKKVKDKNDTYFLKIVQNNSVDINRIQKIIEIYDKYDINTIKLLDYGYIDNKVYLIYNFIDGFALNTVYDKYDVNDYSNMGFNIGSSYKKINFKHEFDNDFVNNYDLNTLVNECINSFKNVYNGKLSYIKNIINEKRMTNIINRMKELTSSFNNEKKAYIHADMHPKNIMIDNNQNLYIIDIESFCIDYFVMNVRWSIIAAFRNKENNEFFKGFINGYYDNNIPDSFNKQLIFITIFNFLEHTIEFSKTKEKEFIIDYISKINLLFNSVDLFSDNNILDNTTIFNK
mgnify:FL=1